MIWLSPRRVTIAGQELNHVDTIAVNRRADKLVVDYSDLGPEVAFADVPERRATIVIRRAVVANESTTLRPGQMGSLAFQTSPVAADAPYVEVAVAQVVVVSIDHEVSAKSGATQTITCIAVSADGASDPVTETIVEGK